MKAMPNMQWMGPSGRLFKDLPRGKVRMGALALAKGKTAHVSSTLNTYGLALALDNDPTIPHNRTHVRNRCTDN